MMKRLTFTLLISIIMAGVGFSQPLSPIIDSIPLQDGEKLAADVYIPPNCNQCPTILVQTPYNRIWYRWGLPLIDTVLSTSPYAYVIVDWRGFYGSIGAFKPNPDRGLDGYDCVDWIANQTWSDGKVGTWGPSALGIIQYQTAQKQHPNHTCAVPLVATPITEYERYYPNGVLRTEYVEQLDGLGFGVSTLVLANPVENTLWQVVESNSTYPQDIQIPVLGIGGWYDHHTDDMINYFDMLKQQSSAAPEHKFLMGPWAHGGSGSAYVGSTNQGELNFPLAEGWPDSLALKFFEYHLLDSLNNGWAQQPNFTYYQMGDHVWLDDTAWPPTTANPVSFFIFDGQLDPSLDIAIDDSTQIVYDPTDPSPTHGGPTLRQDQSQGPYDQSDTVETRNDIAIFDYTVITSNPVTVKGQPKVVLTVSSDKTDTDFAVRLTDVYPDGRSMLLSDGIMRMRFRNGLTANDTSLINPGEQYEIEITLPHLAHTFLPGHKVRLDITSSNYPRFNRNMNTGGEMYPDGNGDTLVNPEVATNYVYEGFESKLILPLEDFTLSTNTIEKNNQVKVYPNPSNGFFTIVINSLVSQTFTAKVFDISGKEVAVVFQNQFIEGSNKVNWDADLTPGIYFLELKGSKTGREVKKLIIR